MKTAKRDTRYIIKRILIGVGIALILANLRKCNVYAEELTPAYINNFGFNLMEITSSPWSQTDDTVVYNFDYGSYDIKVSNDSGKYFYFSLFKDDYNNYYYVSSNTFNYVSNCESNFDFTSINFTSSSIDYKNNNTTSCSATSVPFFHVRSLSINNFNNSTIINYFTNNLSMENLYNQTYENNLYQKVYTFSNESLTSSNVYNVINYLKNNTSLVYSSIPIYLDNQLIEQSFPDFSLLDISNYQAVYFVPKNYSTIPKNDLDGINFIDFPFYYKGTIKTGYFNINNTSQLVFSTNNLTSSDFTYFEGSFPLYYDDQETDLNSYLITNSSLSECIIYYKDSLFDYYLIEDMTNYNQTISIIDDNGNSSNSDISFTQTLEQLWQNGFITGGNSWLSDDNGFVGETGVKINSLFDFIKSPILFLKSIFTEKCEPISFNFLSSTMTFTCISPIYSNIFKNNLHLFLNLVGFIICYKVTIVNIQYIISTISLENDKLEVIDL